MTTTASIFSNPNEVLDKLNREDKEFELKQRIKRHDNEKQVLKENNLYVPEPFERFIINSRTLGSDKPQEYIKRDPQYDNLCLLLKTQINSKKTLVDFGSGPYLNLMKQIIDHQGSQSHSSLIRYFAIDKCLNELDKSQFNKLIENFNNKSKKFDEVFFDNYSKLYNYLNNVNKDFADITVVKNVNHEVNIVNLPDFIDCVYSITKKNGKIYFYDLSLIEEPFNFPWTEFIYERVFKDILNCTFNYTAFEQTEKRKALHFCSVDKTTTESIDKECLKKKLIDIFDSYILELINVKDKIINGDREFLNKNSDEINLEYIKTVIYHSNIEQQLRQAKKIWKL